MKSIVDSMHGSPIGDPETEPPDSEYDDKLTKDDVIVKTANEIKKGDIIDCWGDGTRLVEPIFVDRVERKKLEDGTVWIKVYEIQHSFRTWVKVGIRRN